tara:strand:+ start:1052 stop:1540 length:489 start_codon:yes stop_codon:yes gene_type:complete
LISIRPITDADWGAIWGVLEPVFRAGETYAYPINITKDQARAAWVDQPAATFVAEDADLGIVGTYMLKANQPGRGAHVCNCGYVVSEAARGQGVASAMCDHSQDRAREMGFRAMQYNLVVATNEGAVRLWKSKGFDIIGTLPGAFDHPRLGYVDAHVMYKTL